VFSFKAWKVLPQAPSASNKLIAQQLFTTGVPPAGGENVRMNLWLFQGKTPQNRSSAEVIINRFEFAP